ncbi:hypothetical protein [Myceligenerans halotolerans]
MIVILLAGTVVVPIPVGGGGAFLALLLPAVLIGAALAAVGESPTGPERVGLRALPVRDAAVVVTSAVLSAGILSIVAVAAETGMLPIDGGLTAASARNVLGYLGVGLTAWAVVPRRYAAVVPLLVAVVSVPVASRYRFTPEVWLLHPHATAVSFVAAGTCLVIGLLIAVVPMVRRSA